MRVQVPPWSEDLQEANCKEVDTGHGGEDAGDEPVDQQLPRRLILGRLQLVGAVAAIGVGLSQHDDAAQDRRGRWRRRLIGRRRGCRDKIAAPDGMATCAQ